MRRLTKLALMGSIISLFMGGIPPLVIACGAILLVAMVREICRCAVAIHLSTKRFVAEERLRRRYII